MDALRQWARVEGVFAAPEGAVALLLTKGASKFFMEEDQVFCFSTRGPVQVPRHLGKREGADKKLPTSRQIAGTSARTDADNLAGRLFVGCHPKGNRPASSNA
jgi:hypothetical protein